MAENYKKIAEIMTNQLPFDLKQCEEIISCWVNSYSSLETAKKIISNKYNVDFNKKIKRKVYQTTIDGKEVSNKKANEEELENEN